MILNDIYPIAVRAGMSKREFFHSTMHDVNVRIEAFGKSQEETVKRLEYHSWLTGMYVMHSISCNFSKKATYPKNPIEIDTKDIKQVAKKTGKSEEELRQEEMYMALRIRQANANIQETKERIKNEKGG